MMQFQGFDWLSGHMVVHVYEPLYHAQEIATINFSWLFLKSEISKD